MESKRVNREDKDENNCFIPSLPSHPSVWFGCIFSAKVGAGTLGVRGFFPGASLTSQVPGEETPSQGGRALLNPPCLFLKELKGLEIAFFVFFTTSLTNTDTLYLHNIFLVRLGPRLELPEYAFYSVQLLKVEPLISLPACVLPLSYFSGLQNSTSDL